MRLLPGRPQPLGATWDGEGVDFALYSAHATRVELCLFDGGREERVELPERTGDVWHARLPELRPGALYGYRVHGPWAPEAGHRFNPHKLLVDPYTRALHGGLRFDPALLGHDPADPGRPGRADSAPFVPRCVVVAPPAEPPPRGPGTPWSRTVIYECHVKGSTWRHPAVPEAQRGRFLGLASPPMLAHLRDLGVTAVQLLPVAQTCVDDHLARLGLPNYWGYSPLGFLAPDARFASGSRGEQVEEFRAMVRALHEAGIEVLLDVVFNHTPEGGPEGATLSLRGIDNANYYRLDPADRSQYLDVTGCGNTLDASHPQVLQLVLDSLRAWVLETGVDGFRFDLAAALGRDPLRFDAGARFFQLVHQDPVLANVKLVAEPWDLGAEGYQLGRFPVGWSEWNDRFRDVARRTWRGDAGQLAELGGRLTGSSDLFSWNGRGTCASVNYVASHDGMTLLDLVSYSHRHNEANGEGGRDGGRDESHNWGVEGPSRDRRVRRMRERVRRNLAATLALSLGVPMWRGGDELGHSQGGNNNAYCQDNETSWLAWHLPEEERQFLAFVQSCFAARAGNAVFRRRHHLDGALDGAARWLRPDGRPMRHDDWRDPAARCLVLVLDASGADPVDEDGRPQEARTVALLMNADRHTHSFQLPGEGDWREVLHTACQAGVRSVRGSLRLAPDSLVLLERSEP